METQSQCNANRWAWISCAAVALVALADGVSAGKANFKRTDSRSQYVHRIPIYDEGGRQIDPADPGARPYSPRATCMKCHDYARINHGYHFPTAQRSDSDRAGAAWIWTDRRTGSQIPLSRRGWPGTYTPDDVGLSPLQFVQQFGGHMCGGFAGPLDEVSDRQQPVDQDAGSARIDGARWNISGVLRIDCMLCHAGDRQYSYEQWAKHVGRQNFAWAATAALGLANVVGVAKSLPDNFDPSQAGTKGVKTEYDQRKFDAEGNVFFDVVRAPANNACYACHTNRPVGTDTGPHWLDDRDVHIRAGMSCVDCHRNGIDHHTIRGFEGEEHPTGAPVWTFSCRGCHWDGHGEPTGGSGGGRLGAPRPRHAGLPTFHLQRLSCTSCHSGPRPGPIARAVQTSTAHNLGVALQSRDDNDPPGIVQPVFRPNTEGVLYPYRMTWPAFWGWMLDAQIVPANPDQIYKKLRRTLRVRKDLRAEVARVRLSDQQKAKVLGAEAAARPEQELSAEHTAKLDAEKVRITAQAFRGKLAKGLKELAKGGPVEGATAVYVSGGKVYRMDRQGESVETFTHAAAEAYAWPLAHDVRPARHALGAHGCTECHAPESALFYGRVTPVGPAPDVTPATVTMHELMDQDARLLDAWEQSFRGRPACKWFGLLALTVVVVAGTRTAPRPRLVWLARLFYAAAIVSLIALTASSFDAIQRGGSIRGWTLLAHVSVGGALVALLPFVALMRAGLCGGHVGDGGPQDTADRAQAPERMPPAEPRGGLARTALWLFLAGGTVAAGTMLVGMLSLFGTRQMEYLLLVHRYAGIALVLAALLHLSAVCFGRFGRR